MNDLTLITGRKKLCYHTVAATTMATAITILAVIAASAIVT